MSTVDLRAHCSPLRSRNRRTVRPAASASWTPDRAEIIVEVEQGERCTAVAGADNRRSAVADAV